MYEYTVLLNWDNEAAVWIATSCDIPGLVLEAGSIDALIERVRFAVPELLTLNGNPQSSPISMCFRSERHEQVHL
jgi:predicted RNase H-like HicB family nuclease